MRWVGHGKRRYYTASMCVCVTRESLRVLGVLLATRLVLGVLLARHGRRELRGNTRHARYELSPCPCPRVGYGYGVGRVQRVQAESCGQAHTKVRLVCSADQACIV